MISRHPYMCIFTLCAVLLLFSPSEVFAGEKITASAHASSGKKSEHEADTGQNTSEPVAESAAFPEVETVRVPSPAMEVVVSATRTARELFEVPSTMAVVNQKQMDREPKTTVAESLQDIPGVQIQDQGMGGAAKRVIIRGESPKRVLVLIDGMKVSEQKSMDGSMILIDPNNIERIEVVKGPASVLYGSEAIGGVINIITKKGGTRPVQGSAVMTYDASNDSFTPYASLYGKLSGFSYRVSGDYTDAGDKRGGSGRIDNSSYRQRNASAYMNYAWQKLKIGGGYDFYKADIEVPGANASSADGSRVNINLDLPEWKRERWYGFIEANQLSNVLQKVSLTSFTSYIEKDFRQNMHVDIPRITMNPILGWGLKQDVRTSIATLNKQRSYGLTLQTDWTLGEAHYVIFGLDYLRDNLKAYQERGGNRIVTDSTLPPMFPPNLKNGVYPLSSNGDFFYKGHQETYAAFLQDEWTLTPDWTATLGARGTWVRSKLTDTNAALDTGADSDSNVSFSAGLVYSGLENWRFRTQYAQGYRYPLLNEMYIGTPHGSSGILYPNPDLKPEKSQSVEAGARYSNAGWDADLAVYHTWSRDYIYQQMLGRTDDSRFENSEKARTFGVELTMAYTIEEFYLTPYLQGAFMNREYESNSGTTSRTGDPRWTGRAGLRFAKDVAEQVELHADLYMRGAARAKNKSSTETLEYPGWGTLNFATGTRFGEERNFFVDLNLNNILDKTYTYASSSLEEPGFHAVVRVGVEF